MIDWILRILLFLLSLFFVGTRQDMAEPPPPQPILATPTPTVPAASAQDAENTVRSLTFINDVQVNVMESFPMQISLEVSGEQPDGCEFPVFVEQSREGDTVNVEIYRNVPIDVICPMILVPYNDTITLEGGFEPGEYTININDFSIDLSL